MSTKGCTGCGMKDHDVAVCQTKRVLEQAAEINRLKAALRQAALDLGNLAASSMIGVAIPVTLVAGMEAQARAALSAALAQPATATKPVCKCGHQQHTGWRMGPPETVNTCTAPGCGCLAFDAAPPSPAAREATKACGHIDQDCVFGDKFVVCPKCKRHIACSSPAASEALSHLCPVCKEPCICETGNDLTPRRGGRICEHECASSVISSTRSEVIEAATELLAHVAVHGPHPVTGGPLDLLCKKLNSAIVDARKVK